ncbi:MAG: HAD family hydrolase [Pseudomonadota bacterium]
MMGQPLRIAMWSGPRNMSTTMMRSFGARSDSQCVDEPFYAAYLKATGLQHPMSEEIFASQSAVPDQVIAALTGPIEPASSVFYQKHMTHHMVAEIPRDWMSACRNVFLIRHPARVIPSYARKMETVSLEAIGFPQQLSLFERAAELEGQSPLVIDSTDILRAPEEKLRTLCSALNIEWQPAMLAWSAGPKPEDGAWAPHWYDAVWKSTGFADAPAELPKVPEAHLAIYEQALAIYDTLAAHRL